ncbi:MAG: SRPBCC family protein [Methyloceanibacter sp.]|nr:SRPBCC family protein [Methyloceanibacter sp.]
MQTYETRHRVAHGAEDMYALVANVEDYPTFLPLCEALDIVGRETIDGKEVLTAKMEIGYKLIRERFTSRVTLDPEFRAILVEYVDGPFEHLENRWVFEPHDTGGSEIDFFIAYKFRSRIFERLVGSLFDKAVRKYTDAFEARADQVYGTKSGAFTS